jgi:acyl-CoA synthetase (AMP-forming)/AMP-acid ligase II
MARAHPDYPAMIFNDNQATYRQVNEAVDRCGAALPQLGASAVDELCVRGPQVMKGYWNIPTETANALRPDPEGGDRWLYSGNMAVMDADGTFCIVDRKKDMILGADGFNIYPREIEELLCEHPKVLEAAAVGVPVEGKGDRGNLGLEKSPGSERAPTVVGCRVLQSAVVLLKLLRQRILDGHRESETGKPPRDRVDGVGAGQFHLYHLGKF